MRNKMTNKQTTTFNGVCELIEQQKQEEDMAYPMMHERSHDGTCTIENCLSDYTDLEVMDEDNMFICSECNKKVSYYRITEIVRGRKVSRIAFFAVVRKKTFAIQAISYIKIPAEIKSARKHS